MVSLEKCDMKNGFRMNCKPTKYCRVDSKCMPDPRNSARQLRLAQRGSGKLGNDKKRVGGRWVGGPREPRLISYSTYRTIATTPNLPFYSTKL